MQSLPTLRQPHAAGPAEERADARSGVYTLGRLSEARFEFCLVMGVLQRMVRKSSVPLFSEVDGGVGFAADRCGMGSKSACCVGCWFPQEECDAVLCKFGLRKSIGRGVCMAKSN